MASDYIGYVVHYEGERDRGAYVPWMSGNLLYVAEAMMANRPGVTICIEPITIIPEWIEN